MLWSVPSYRLLRIYKSITAGLHFCSWAMGARAISRRPQEDRLFNQLLATSGLDMYKPVIQLSQMKSLGFYSQVWFNATKPARSWSQSLTPKLLLSLQLFCKATTLHLCVHVINWPVAIDNIFLKRLDQSDPINTYNCPITFQIIQNE